MVSCDFIVHLSKLGFNNHDSMQATVIVLYVNLAQLQFEPGAKYESTRYIQSWNALQDSLRYGIIKPAQKLLSWMPQTDVFSWNSLSSESILRNKLLNKGIENDREILAHKSSTPTL